MGFAIGRAIARTERLRNQVLPRYLVSDPQDLGIWIAGEGAGKRLANGAGKLKKIT